MSILRLTGQPSRDFVTNRYVATVILGNSNRLNPIDYQCATNSRFQDCM